ncbi:hypothetical protein J4856_03810 [Prevotella scopos JCM 17725]|uniref:Uncharacterized protein n=1 Tax=Prevotella scopos JCM 17725 TaxID=1236518 RepID=A0AAX2F6Q9_9BACT|nr:hypothetical protein [Prevotella scopos]ANR73548.1 hypothetical protein AXF22_08600 [Prevotella scopos JCM 17725]QUB44134.1 hypothetical protein J4856_03810 [Prevotella scopos JCM 17725]SHG11779.1 hypothetical protein SAMN05444364_13814 [Prevotella scopos JCM 17725]
MQKPQWNRIKDFVQRKELSLAMGLHLGAIFLCGLIYILLPEDIHLRWGLTYWLIWIVLLSPIPLMIAARKSKRKLVIRLYSGVIGIGLWLFAIFLQAIGGDIFLPPTYFCKDGDYLARQYRYDFFENNMTAIYKVIRLTERRVAFYRYSSPDSIKVYDSLNVIAFYCPTRIVEDPWVSDTIAPIRVIEQLYDRPIEPEQKKEVEQLAHRLNARLGYTLAE